MMIQNLATALFFTTFMFTICVAQESRVCSYQESYLQSVQTANQSSYRSSYSVGCGFLGWGRCARYSQKYRISNHTQYHMEYRQSYRCCSGSEKGSNRQCTHIEKPTLECPYVDEQFVVTDQLQLELSWPEPTYYDNSGLLGVINSTHSSPTVFDIGVHNVTYFAWDPHGNSASCSITIRITATCPEIVTIVNSTSLLWLQTPALNKDVDSNERCDVRTENRGRGLATRVCMRDEIRGALWFEPIYVGCGEKENFTLADLSETPVIDSNVENVAEALINATQQQSDGGGAVTIEDVQAIAETFRHIVDVESVTSEVTRAIIEIANNLVELAEEKETNPAEDSCAEYYADILLAIEQQVNRSTAAGYNLTAVKPNIALEITTVMPNQPAGFSFAVLDSGNDEFREDDIQTYSDPDDITEEQKTTVVLPAVIFNTTSNDTIGVSFVVHKSDVLFPTKRIHQTVGSDIVSAIVTGVESIEDLSQPVVLEFTVSGENSHCVFWNFEIQDWSREGCQLVTTKNRTFCHCNHLTNFAVLVDVSYDPTHTILDYVSQIGCCVSLLTLLITLIIFIGFRRLRIGSNAIPRQILINLCLALFFLYLIFLVGIDQNSHRNGCMCVAFLLQYLTLASLMWMGVEGFNLYFVIVWPFAAHPHQFVLKAAIIAWGLPLLISAISIGTGFSYYNHSKYCFVDTGPPLFYGVVLPIALILLSNLVMFSVVTYRLSKSNLGGNTGQRSTKEKNIKRLKNAFAMSILMGLTWIFGFFAIGDAQFAFSLIFCVCNSIQGLVLFLLFCVRQEDVRKILCPFLQRCKSSNPRKQSQTALTGDAASMPRSQPPSNGMDFSASLPPSPPPDDDTNLGNVVPVVPMSSADKPAYENPSYKMRQKAGHVAPNDDYVIARVSGQKADYHQEDEYDEMEISGQ